MPDKSRLNTSWISRVHLPLLALAITALDLLLVYGVLGQRLYPLNPVWIYLLLYAIAFGVYVYAAGRVVPSLNKHSARAALLLILCGAALYRLSVVFAPPQLSTDIFLYVWDGRLINHGINPYHWAPNALPLRFLRDSIWNQTEYKSYQSIYMPVSQGVFALANALFGSNPIGYKFLYMLFDFGVIGLLLVILKRLNRPLTQVIWVAWCPLPITEVSLAGHQDIVGVFFLLAALALAMRKKKPGGWKYAGGVALLLVASVMTKGFALLLLPLFARVHGRAFAVWAACGLLYLGMPLWVYLPEFLHGMHQYLENVHVNSGLFAWVNLGLSHITRHWHYWITEKLSDAALLGVTYWSIRRPVGSYTELLRRSFVVLAVTLLVIPTLFPWYLLWTIVFIPLLGKRPLYPFVLLSGLSVLLYVYYYSMQAYWWVSAVEYGPFYALLAWELWKGRTSNARNDLQHSGRAGDGRAALGGAHR
jgi:alpha-1,6-mannosyltransferase